MTNIVSKKASLILLFLFSFLFIFSSTPYSQHLSLKQLTFSDSSHDGYPYWSPDSKYIIYSSGTRSGCTTMKIPVEGGNPTELTDYFSQHAQWSPDGHYIVFDGDFGTRIYLASAQGGPPVRIVPDDILVKMSGMPCWSHDGKMIAFHSFGVLYTLELKSAEFKKIFHLEGKKILPYSWTKDSKIIYASALDTTTREYDIWKIPLIGEPEQITFLEKRQTKPSLSPDDSLMVITSTHGGNPDLWIMPSNGGNMVQITFFEGDERNRGFDVEASWSPDGKYIAFSSTRTDYWAIWLMEPDMEYIKNKLKNN